MPPICPENARSVSGLLATARGTLSRYEKGLGITSRTDKEHSTMDSSSKEQAAALNIGTFNQVKVASGQGFDQPQVGIFQTSVNDFARLRFTVSGRSWDIATNGIDEGLMNFFNHQRSSNAMTLRGNGNLSIKGTLTQGSSRTLKENIVGLSSKEALETLNHLNPVKFRYKADAERAHHIGFIAEEVPELVATPDRQGLSPMDIVGVLTKAVQEQQKTIVALAEKVKTLEGRNGVR
jgi:Chaperone of endosialidase